MSTQQKRELKDEIIITVGEGADKVEMPCYTVQGLSKTMPGKRGKSLSPGYIYKGLKRGMPHFPYAGMKLFPKKKEFLEGVLFWLQNDKTLKQREIEKRNARLYAIK